MILVAEFLQLSHFQLICPMVFSIYVIFFFLASRLSLFYIFVRFHIAQMVFAYIHYNRNFELPAILCVKSFFLDINICTSKSWAGFWRCILKTGRGLFNCFYIAFLCKNFKFPIVLFFCGAVVLFKHLVDFAASARRRGRKSLPSPRRPAKSSKSA